MAASVGAQMIGVKQVVAELRAKSLKGTKTAGYVCGYTAHYAIYQHENLLYNHPNGGQAKYLEHPARTKAKEMRRVIKQKLTSKKSLDQALLTGITVLYDASQKLVPVDTGYLKSTGFIAPSKLTKIG